MATHPTSPSRYSDLSVGRVLTRRRLLSLAVGSTAAVVAGPMPGRAGAAQRARPGPTPGDRIVASRLSAERALQHLRVLTEDIGPRIGGTASEEAAADYIAGVLDRLGYATTLQPFAASDKFLAEIGSPAGLPDDLCWQAGASPQASLDVDVSGEAIDVGAGAPESYPADATGKIVFVDDDPAVRDQRVTTAVDRGAAAVVLLPADRVEPRRAPAFVPTLAGPVTVPVVGAAQAHKHRLRDLLATGPLTLVVATRAHRGLTSHNVLGERPGIDNPPAGPVVMVTAHYDSVIGAPGASDDGSGTALCLELARVLRGLPSDAAVRVALWGSEEQGLVGSRHYVAQLPQTERDRIHAVFQNDMVGTSWEMATRYWLLSWTGLSNRATDEVAAAVTRLGYGDVISPVTQRGASDHQSFQEVGIAAGNFSWRAPESPALLEPPYHTPEDTIAKNISPQRLGLSMRFIGCAAYNTAGPRWE